MVLLCTSQQDEGLFCKQETGELFAELLKENSSLHYGVVGHTRVKEEGGRREGGGREEGGRSEGGGREEGGRSEGGGREEGGRSEGGGREE